MKEIEGIKLISHNSAGYTTKVTQEESIKMPFICKIIFRPPEFMKVTFILMVGGTEEIVFIAESIGKIYEFLELNRFLFHPRFLNCYINDKDIKELINQ